MLFYILPGTFDTVYTVINDIFKLFFLCEPAGNKDQNNEQYKNLLLQRSLLR